MPTFADVAGPACVCASNDLMLTIDGALDDFEVAKASGTSRRAFAMR